jgi:hypothetical protein
MDRIKLQENLNKLLSQRAIYDGTLHDEEWLQDCNVQIAEQEEVELAEEERNGCLDALTV